MSKREFLFSGTALATYLLFGVASYLPLRTMWGINHLMFLPEWSVYLYALAGLVLIYLLFGKLPEDSIGQALKRISTWLWEGPWWHRGIVASAALVVFYLFKVQTNLLGDGFTCIADFGRGKAYVHKWAEPGSIYLLRWVQAALGGYDHQSALTAFRILSFLSGGIFVLASLATIRRICTKNISRWATAATVFFSGGMLLFFGYVEFYPMVWAASAAFLFSGIRYVQEKKGLWFVLLASALAIAMHIEAIYFLPSVFYLVASGYKSETSRRTAYIVLCTSLVAGAAVFVWLYNTRLSFETLILPFLKARPEAPGYTIFSLIHFSDLFNEVLLVIPGALVLLVELRSSGWKQQWDQVCWFLLIASAGSLSFLLVFGAAITMGRDWDVMSLSLLAPLLLIFYRLDKQESPMSLRTGVTAAFLSVVLTVPFLSVSIHTETTEARFYTLLSNRNRNTWMVYANYFLLKGDETKYKDVMTESYSKFPDYITLQKGYRLLNAGDLSSALPIARQLIDINPYNPDFMQFLASVYRGLDRYDSSEYYYKRALAMRPYLAPCMNELAQLYIKQARYDDAARIEQEAHLIDPEKTYITETLGLIYVYRKDLDAASALADTLFQTDSTSPGGHLLKMTVALNSGKTEIAREQYRAYLKYGQDRSDYQNIKSYYSYLSKESD